MSYDGMLKKIERKGGLPDEMKKALEIASYIHQHIDKDNAFEYMFEGSFIAIELKHTAFTNTILEHNFPIYTKLLIYSNLVFKDMRIDVTDITRHKNEDFLRALKEQAA